MTLCIYDNFLSNSITEKDKYLLIKNLKNVAKMMVELSTKYQMAKFSTKNCNRRQNNSSKRRTKSGRNYLL